MVNIVEFICDHCGNSDPNKAEYYDGMLGYESITCLCCGYYYDHYGVHPVEKNSSYMKSKVLKNNQEK